MPRTGRLSAGLLIALALTIIVLRLPAHLAAYLLENTCAGSCRLADTSGSLWRGNGHLYLRAAGEWYALGRLAWQLPTRDALLRVRLEQGQASWKLPARIDLDGIALPAAALLGQEALALPAGGWHGQLVVADTHITRQAGAWQGTGVVRWQDAASELLGNHPLGDYRINWQSGQPATARFSGGDGREIRISGELAGTHLQADVNLQGEARSRLARYLSLLPGTVSGAAGQFRIDYRQP